MLSKLITEVSSLNQNNLFKTDPETAIEKACVDYLKYKGYRVVSPKKFAVQINNVTDLVKYFYLLLNSKHPENFAASFNLTKELAIAKRFVISRMEATGASKEYALNECGEIIRTLFDNEEEFKFKYALTFSIFGQNNLKWVTDKALFILNKKLKEREEEEVEVLSEKMIEAQDTSDLGFNDLDDLLSRLEEEDNGKKEK